MVRRASQQKPGSGSIRKNLARYREKRDFNKTAEPRGGPSAAAKPEARGHTLAFVIQKHDATRLHYDFRLEWDGVLKSWAVAKGPSYFPGDKRLAVQVEDHPLEYGGFEGIIPKGEYGGGTVMLWDRGSWEPLGDASEGLAKGNLKFTLHGKKLHGKWALIRMGGRAASEAKPNWLLIKEHDQYEQAEKDPSILEDAPDSVTTGRDLKAIAAQEDRVWHSREANGEAAKGSGRGKARTKTNAAKRRRKGEPIATKALARLPRETMPAFVQPQLASLTAAAPEGDGWLHELKLDGYRMQAHIRRAKAGPEVKLLTRKGLDWTHRMADIAAELKELPVEAAILDGEVVALTPSGASSFQLLQQAFHEERRQPLYYFVFDLLHLNGHSLRGEPLTARKAMLAQLLGESNGEDDEWFVRLSEHLEEDGGRVFAHACRLGLEGIVSKRADAPYSSARGGSWLKIKCGMRQEFVIGGFTLPSDGGRGIGALLLGYYEGKKLIYAGRTGTGFTQAARRAMRERLEKLRRSGPAFDAVPAEAARGVRWVTPGVVTEVAFATWTADHLVRQASFKGVRDDKPAADVVRETEEPVPKTPQKAKSAAKHSSAPVKQKAVAGKRAPAQTHAYEIRLTHPDKELDAESHLTKQELADYYLAIAQYMLPYIAGRPLSLVRCPDGSGHPCFFQKHVTAGMPDGIEGTKIAERGGGKAEEYITLSTPEALAGLAQMGVMEIHPWGSRNDAVEKPDHLIFDLDPGEGITWRVLASAAEEVRAKLKRYGLTSFVKLTGGKGLHVVAPLTPKEKWPAVKEFARRIALEIEAAHPELYLTKMTRAARRGRIFLDYLRNDRGSTAVAPYSPRARSGAPAAMPLAWKELSEGKMPVFRVHDFKEWSSRLRRDPWKAMAAVRQSLPEPG
ncbi:DNA ligase D [Paracidobacterium acidisoli]|uniref:DNA ligase (ATP) n=1 Tax=Paracidobacterium acidisoli TaxID=2303751 RepID=A0A372ILR3_9BACT|nr:DNA ligase D [Paracidobacterium acidisoli]MBT9332287.1 DNA ligase D [Paracidobacterium acidisoli]